MATTTRKTKDRSPSFPFINLETAIRRAKQFYDVEKRGMAPVKVAAGHWNYSPSSSGALQTMAALKNYGLMDDEGSGDQRKLRLTDLALRILLDARPDSVERAQYMRQAALAPQVAAEVYLQWPHDLPSESNLNHYLIFDRKFNAGTARKVVKILYENEELTSGVSLVLESDEADTGTDMETANAEDSRSSFLPMFTRGAAQRANPGAEHVEVIPAPGAVIKLTFSGEPTLQTFEYLEKYLALRKSFLKSEPDQ